ncbi:MULTISPECIES: sarcosine oxidase subunit gamma family protein [unclassified Rhizobium]|uniref:sarcosine oxidase subunit gamma n=1 Tax=unclassified Rhizobium TaxID=2613769 RepID=UPI000EA93ECB|nr:MULTISPECIES: sarcosine oxidase subunit gamma family protein [unclassified Rhizobium]AYG70224.1 sarcosine oxidase subunit gamma [Rhizobium sp. CCGE531]AYG76595.1 sarcosine oxidase subunit gamma [Rhizobium sp. CCGE532]
MPDLPIYRPALAGKAALGGETIRLEALPEGHLLHVMGAATTEEIKAHLLGTGLKASSVRPAGYRQWFVAGNDRLSAMHLRALTEALAGRAFISDQSHGRIRIRVSGLNAAQVLNKGTAVDLHPSAFPEGSTAMTLFGHISMQLTRTGADDFELTVLRSFAESLHEELEALAVAHGAEHLAS